MNFQELEKHLKFELIIRVIIYILIGLCFIISLIAILVSPVKAATNSVDITNSLSIPTAYSGCSQSNGYYWGDDGGSNTCKMWQVKRTYNGVLYSLEMVLKNAWVLNEVAFVNITGMSSDFRNNNLYCIITNSSNTSLPCNITFSSKSELSVSFVPTQVGNYTLEILSSSNDAITGINTFGIRSVVIKQTTGDNSDIINNQTQNTNDIIDNNNENTQTVVSKVEELFSQSVANSLQANNDERRTLANMCKNIYYTEVSVGKGLNGSGSLIDFPNSYYMTDYVAINTINDSSIPGTANRLYIKEPASSQQGYYFVFYDNNKNFISLERTATRSVAIPSNAIWFRFSSPSANTVISRYSSQCVNAEDMTLDYLKDDTNPSVNQSGIDDVLSDVEVSDPLNYLLTLPISLLQKLNTVLSANSCQRVSFGSLYNTELYLPCINFEQILGSSLWNTIDLIVGVGLLAVILKRFYDSISNILTLGKEKEVRDKLDLPTPMQFFASILGGGRD